LKISQARIADPVGFHLRAAGRIVKLARKYDSEVTIKFNGRLANAKSIMGLASLAADHGSIVDIEVTGTDEDQAMDAMVKLIEVDLALPEEKPEVS
jgi:phosphocarrier protein HPr